MHVLLVFAHPEPKSYTRALLDTATSVLTDAGHTFEISDLHAEGFNPVAGRHDFTTVANPDYFDFQAEQTLAEEQDGFSADIKREQARVARADVMIFLFPLWWGAAPAILKGWVDRVMSYGFGYVDGARYDRGLFKGRSAMICVATGGTAQRFSDGDTYGTIERVLWPMTHCQLKYMGLTILDPFVAYAAPRVDDGQRKQYLADWESHLRQTLQHLPESSSPKTRQRGVVAMRPLQFAGGLGVAKSSS